MGFREGYLHLHTFKLPAAKKDTVSTVQFPKRDGASDLDLLAGRGKNPSIPIFESFFGGNWNRQKGKDGISAKGSHARKETERRNIPFLSAISVLARSKTEAADRAISTFIRHIRLE